MIKIGVCGLGMMGLTHIDIYGAMDGVEVVAVADADEARLSGATKAAGNIEGQAQGGLDYARVQKFSDAGDLIAQGDVDVVDICLPTPLHGRFALLAMAAKKHVLVEKPLCRTAQEAREFADAAQQAETIVMPAMCMRFWPGWDWLHDVVHTQKYGAVLGATFRRVVSHPGGRFYLDGDQCGGALLDLHIHDTDFINYCFGKPQAVTSTGYSKDSGAIDHVMTQYHYDDVPLVAAEGGWSMSEGYDFSMRYTVNFEKATACFDLARENPLMVFANGQDPQVITLAPEMGYNFEIAYFLECIREKKEPIQVTLSSAAEALEIYEAELKSIETKQRVDVV